MLGPASPGVQASQLSIHCQHLGSLRHQWEYLQNGYLSLKFFSKTGC